MTIFAFDDDNEEEIIYGEEEKEDYSHGRCNGGSDEKIKYCMQFRRSAS